MPVLPIISLTSRTLRRATLALALVAPAVPAARAGAQDACAAGTLAQYLVSGYTCRIGGWTLSEFSALASVDARGDAQGSAADAASVQLTPFLATDAAGRTTFGFDLAGLTTAASAHGTTSGSESVFAFASLGFWLTTEVPGLQVVGVEAAGAFAGGNATPGALRVGSTYGGGALAMTPGGGIASCDAGLARSAAPGGPPARIGGDCDRPLSGLIIVNMTTSSTARRFVSGTDAVDGGSAGSLTRVAFTQGAAAVVPEPATVTLVGGGLAALAGLGGTRARGRARRPRRPGA
jgi:hypothetical protein